MTTDQNAAKVKKTGGKGGRSGFSASYLTDLSQQADDADLFGAGITQAHQKITHDIDEAAADPSRLHDMDITLLDDNPWQPRTEMDAEELNALAEDMREHGFHEGHPIVVRPHPKFEGRYQKVWGHRRHRAATLAGLKTVPVLVKPYTDEEMIFLSAKENLLREQLSPVDEALMFSNMLQLGYTQVELAQKIRKTRGYIRNRLILNDSPAAVREMVRRDPTTLRAAYYLSKVEEDDVRDQIIHAIQEGEMTGESVPGYLASLKEERQRETLNATSHNDGDASLRVSSEDVSGTKQQGKVPTLSFATDEAQLAEQLAAPVSFERIMADGGQKSEELLATSTLRTLHTKLQKYQDRSAHRSGQPSEAEVSLLREIRALCDTLLANS